MGSLSKAGDNHCQMRAIAPGSGQNSRTITWLALNDRYFSPDLLRLNNDGMQDGRNAANEACQRNNSAAAMAAGE